MEPRVRLSHVAFLVRSAEQAEEATRQFGFPSSPAEVWEGEGTKEIYVGDESKSGRLLLMEPMRDGAYRRAFQKRGAGLHHIAIDVLDLERYVLGLSGTGWLLHPQSLHTMKTTKTVYLARPGFPGLIEAQQRTEISKAPLFIERLEIQVSTAHLVMVNALGIPEIHPSKDQKTWLTCDGTRFVADAFLL